MEPTRVANEPFVVPGIEFSWAHTFGGECQRLVSTIELGQSCLTPLCTARDFLSRIGDPRTTLEEHFLRGKLLELSMRWAFRAHEQFHERGSDSCGFRTDVGMGEAWSDPCVPAKLAFDRWAELFFAALEKNHAAPHVVRVADRIRETHARPLSVLKLARSVGLHPVAMRRQFQAAFGMSVREYHIRARIEAAVPLLRDPAYTTRMVADAVGYRSPKNFYRALKRVTRCGPPELRRLQDSEVARAVHLPAPNSVPRSARVQPRR